MRTLLPILIGVFLAGAAFAEEQPTYQLIREVIRSWPVGSYPALPSISSTMQERVGDEIAASPSVRLAFSQLDANRSNVDWFKGVETLEREKAIWCLQAALGHPGLDIQLKALIALKRFKDPRAVPFLLLYADYMAVQVDGSQKASFHSQIVSTTGEILSLTTGIPIRISSIDPKGVREAVRRWTRWQLDQTQ